MLNAVNNTRKQRGRPFYRWQKRQSERAAQGIAQQAHAFPHRGSRGRGELPLDYMLRTMRDPTASTKRRDEMARAAAPYLHARLAPIDPPQPPDDAADLGEDREIRIVMVPARKRDEDGNFIE
jgi:hypothetical protein